MSMNLGYAVSSFIFIGILTVRHVRILQEPARYRISTMPRRYLLKKSLIVRRRRESCRDIENHATPVTQSRRRL
jgi:hypothetical protein